MSEPRLPRLLRTATFRFAALYVLLFAGSAVVLGLAVYVMARAAMLEQTATRVEAEVATLRAEYQRHGLAGLEAAVAARGQGRAALDYLVQAADGRRLAGEIPPVGSRRGWFDARLGVSNEEEVAPEMLRALAVDLGGGLTLVVGDDLARVTEVEEAILRAFASAIGVVVVLGALGGLLLSWAFLRRVDAIVRTAEAIIDGDLARRIALRGTGDDLDHLAITLNRMLDRIAALMESLRQVSADIAHDLRTPLSRLLQRLERARATARSIAEYEAAVADATGEVQELLRTFTALLRIAQVEGGERRASFHDIDLGALAATVADAFRPAVEDEQHTLTTDIAPGIWVRGDQELLTQLLVNLIENALRHTPAGTCIALVVRPRPRGSAELRVQDNGPGVPADERARVTERFYRCERSRSTPGNGLGLSLVAAVADLHGAALHIDDAGPGLSVRVEFPRQALPHQSRRCASGG